MAVVPRFSLAPDLSVSRLCLGTMTFGEQNSLADSFRLLDLAFSSSINFFDSAEMYPVPQRADTQGRSEEYLGRWIRDRRIPRDKLVIATKVTGPSGQMTWIRGGPACLDAQNISEAIDGSLLRLQTDYIDLYQIHWPDRYVPMFGELEYDTSRQFAAVSVEEQLEALEKAVTSGKIRHIGLSNETPYGIMKFLQVAEEVAPNLKIISVQNSYSLLCRTFDSGLAECCHHESFANTEMRISKLRDIFSRESLEGVNIAHTINESNFCNFLQRISLLAYSPLAMGILSGKYFQSDGGPADARLNLFKGRYSEGESRYNLSKKTLAAAAKGYLRIAKKYGLNPVELAIAFVLRHPQVASTMFGATKLWQLREVISSCNTKLTLEVIGEIDMVHEEFPNPCP